MFGISFLINSILFGVALAMDAFSVSVAAGLANPGMRKSRMATIAGTFCFFQIAMPLIGWLCVRTVAGGGELIAQGVATSIDALSVGFAIEDLPWQAALTEALIIGAVTFAICMGGLRLGRSLGEKLAGKAGIVGGVILIVIGLEIFIKGVL